MACGADSPALLALLSRVQNRDSGEFVCRSTDTEIHIHLRHGRIAWAASAAQPPAFMEHLHSQARVHPTLLRQILRRCHRERLALGGTLMEAGLTTLGGLRCALSHQIEQVIRVLRDLTDAQHDFCPRNYHLYDARLTFDLQDFLHEGLSLSRRRLEGATGLASQILLAVEGLLWAEAFELDECIDTAPEAHTPRTSQALLRDTLLDGADFAAVRTTRAALVGVALNDLRSLWCRVSSDATFGSVVASITSALPTRSVPPTPLGEPPYASWSTGTPSSRTACILRDFLARSRDLEAAVVLHGEEACAFTGCGTGAVPLDTCQNLARRRAHCLALPTSTFTEERERPLDSLHISSRSMVSGEGALWCFGTELLVAQGESLWLFFRRQVSQGLGWAYLTALSRALTLEALQA